MRVFTKKGIFITLSIFLTISILVQFGCTGEREKKAVYVLVDISTSDSKQFDKVSGVIRYLLGSLLPGEFLALARIDSESFNEKDIITRMSFDLRPSIANSQKRAFLESVEKFSKDIKPNSYTDITGGILQAIEYLNEAQANQRYILIFSDFKEEIKKGQVRNFPISFNGAHVVAINATKGQNDNIDSKEYYKRIDNWAKRVEQGGGTWQLADDLNHLDEILD